MSYYDRVADLPVTVESSEFISQERETSRGSSRRTTVVALTGEGHVGYGEDVTYDANEHEAFVAAGGMDVAGTGSVADITTRFAAADMFPQGPPERPVYRNHRQWAYESAVLDLALKQAGVSFAKALNLEYRPVRFVVSSGLGAPPRSDRVHTWKAIDPTLEFKLDVTSQWTPALIEDLAELDGIQILDYKAQSKWVDEIPDDPSLYRLIIDAFPETVFEDPATTPEIREVLESVTDRVSWDSPISDVNAISELPWEPSWLNIKPSRIGSLKSLFACIEYCEEHNVKMYGGGQFELGVGREHLHTIASVFYPDSPNDVAPIEYNDPEPTSGVPTSPLSPPTHSVGLHWSDEPSDR